MNQEVIPVRSKNNNVFYYSGYWQTWNRVLFHDAGGRGMLQFRKKYDIPNSITTIELDLTPVNGFTRYWKDNTDNSSQARIRCHCTQLEGKITGSLPQDVYEEIKEHYSERTLDILLHADLLPFIDFEKAKHYKNQIFTKMMKDIPSGFNAEDWEIKISALTSGLLMSEVVNTDHNKRNSTK